MQPYEFAHPLLKVTDSELCYGYHNPTHNPMQPYTSLVARHPPSPAGNNEEFSGSVFTKASVVCNDSQAFFIEFL